MWNPQMYAYSKMLIYSCAPGYVHVHEHNVYNCVGIDFIVFLNEIIKATVWISNNYYAYTSILFKRSVYLAGETYVVG